MADPRIETKPPIALFPVPRPSGGENQAPPPPASTTEKKENADGLISPHLAARPLPDVSKSPPISAANATSHQDAGSSSPTPDAMVHPAETTGSPTVQLPPNESSVARKPLPRLTTNDPGPTAAQATNYLLVSRSAQPPISPSIGPRSNTSFPPGPVEDRARPQRGRTGSLLSVASKASFSSLATTFSRRRDRQEACGIVFHELLERGASWDQARTAVNQEKETHVRAQELADQREANRAARRASTRVEPPLLPTTAISSVHPGTPIERRQSTPTAQPARQRDRSASPGANHLAYRSNPVEPSEEKRGRSRSRTPLPDLPPHPVVPLRLTRLQTLGRRDLPASLPAEHSSGGKIQEGSMPATAVGDPTPVISGRPLLPLADQTAHAAGQQMPPALPPTQPPPSVPRNQANLRLVSPNPDPRPVAEITLDPRQSRRARLSKHMRRGLSKLKSLPARANAEVQRRTDEARSKRRSRQWGVASAAEA